MCNPLHEPKLARAHFSATFGIISARELDTEIKSAVDAALRAPSAETITEAISVTAKTPWSEAVLFAVAQVGISASAAVLGGDHV